MWRRLVVGWLLLLARGASGVASTMSSTPADCNATSTCQSLTCVKYWWTDLKSQHMDTLILAGAMIFLASFLPRVLIRLIIFILKKFPFLREITEDYEAHCIWSTTYLLCGSLIWGALNVSKSSQFFCRIHIYIWGIFFLLWLYNVFIVVDKFAVRRFGGKGDSSKNVVISESIKLLRLLVMVIAAMYIYLQMWQDQTLLKYSFLGMIGGAIALGFVGATHNAVGGLYLVLNAPFKVDQFIHIGNVKGHVNRVALRYTVVIASDSTKVFVPNSYFLYKPMVNYSQAPKRQLQLDIDVDPRTSVALLQRLMTDLETMLLSRHMGLTSHEDYNGEDKTDPLYFVTMEQLFHVRLYTFTDELDAKKHALIKSEVWLAAMEIMDDLGITMKSRNPTSTSPPASNALDDNVPFVTDFSMLAGPTM
ncbi:Small Conductance Mechanosensitive Ion Channel (MscS) Family [Achlya hypogyna]|uniref:Small Conductance Mechanosensitive Ion Channel (MscS) Family n=1 Tax=Achlya hypogyna TaxID=1202772 RepID=A0A1V9Y5V8_ACHHY|nr:Small Conductance Mechanosensitive Ion Channel (MscS) Family [Achlya hypogyna]